MNQATLEIGEDGLGRCPWGTTTPDYIVYHDEEWGVPTTDEQTLFEKLCLEGFQAGLSWLTILRKREGFRDAFDNFDATKMAKYSADDVARLVTNAEIVRHRGKIESAINNARKLIDMWNDGSSLAQVIWSHEPQDQRSPESLSDVPAITPASTALSKTLKRRGFSFVGPTTAYAGMQAMGVVNDHLVGCHARPRCAELRDQLVRPQL